jgi:hypothetical protein
VIKFKCVYCGQRIEVKDEGQGKKGKCPKCAHLLTVPASTKGRPAISVEKTEPITQTQHKEYIPEWAKEEPSPIYIGADDSVELFRERLGFLIPTYDSLSVFLMAIIWILFLVTNTKTQDHITYLMSYFPTKYPGLNMLAAGLAFSAFIVLCFYMVLSDRDKTGTEKQIMAFFAVITTIIITYTCGTYLNKTHKIVDWQIIFPMWNLFNARMLLTMLTRGVINEECVSDRQATPIQLFLGLTAVIAIFLFCNYTFKLYWAITFSICIAYTTSFDRAIQNVFPGLTGQKYEQSEV